MEFVLEYELRPLQDGTPNPVKLEKLSLRKPCVGDTFCLDGKGFREGYISLASLLSGEFETSLRLMHPADAERLYVIILDFLGLTPTD